MVKHKQNKEESSIPRVVDRRKSISSAVSSISSNISEIINDSLTKIKPSRKSNRKSLPNIKIKKIKNSEAEDRDESKDKDENEDVLSVKNIVSVIKKKTNLVEEIDLEYAKLESFNQPIKKENICSICEMPNFLVDCQGTCQQSFHLDCVGLLKLPSGPFLCDECQNDCHICFLCKKLPSKENNLLTFKCSHVSCGKFFHSDCIKESHLFQKEENDTNQQHFICPAHHCRTCFLEQGMEKMSQASKGRLIKCFRCPLSYHYGEHCIPAGSITLNSNYIICPAHFRPLKNSRAHFRLNVTWCFSCCKKDDLIGCNQCPAAYHPKCLENLNKSDSEKDEIESRDSPSSPASSKIKLEQLSPLSNSSNGTFNTLSSGKSHQIESNWTCDDCLLGKKLLNGQIVWAKVGIYRWWPAQICVPKYLPENLRDRPFQVGEFPVKFFGTNDYYWLTIGRCFSFAEEDESQKPSGQSKSLANAFNLGVKLAKIAYEQVEKLKTGRIAIEVNKPDFQMIKSNRPVGNVIVNKCRLDEISHCECKPESPSPCSSDRDCLNRMLNHECHPAVCSAGDRCMNQRFVKKLYPKQEPFFTGSRGWGLRSLIDIKKGEFINEYVGELITKEECKRRLDIANKNGTSNFYYLTIDSNRIIDAGPKGNLSRFANHSCEPNMETQKWVVNGNIRIGLFALVDIPAFTELTFNYNLDCLSNEKAVCKCGAKNCSGFIGERPKNNPTDAKVSRSNTSLKSETSSENFATEEAKNSKKRKLNDGKKERLSVCLPKTNGSEQKKRTMSLASNETKKLDDRLVLSNTIDPPKDDIQNSNSKND